MVGMIILQKNTGSLSWDGGAYLPSLKTNFQSDGFLQSLPSADRTACGSAVSDPSCLETEPESAAADAAGLVDVVMSLICRSEVER